MRNILRKLTAFIILISVLPIAGCSGKDTGEKVGNVDNTADVSETSTTDGAVHESDGGPQEDLPETEPAEIEIVRDDRSIDLKEYGYSGGFVKYYYETALLPDTVKNHEKINKAIEAKKEEFFAADGYRKEIGLDDVLGVFDDPVDWHCYASVKSVYLDEKYYSVNVQYYSCFGGTDMSVFRGYTYDLDTGEEVGLKDVLGKNDSELSLLLYDKVDKYFFEEVGMSEYPAKDAFLSDEYYGTFNYCIAGDGRIYVLYDKNSIGTGYMGGFAFYIDKYSDDINNVRYSVIKGIEGGRWYSLTKSQLDEVYRSMEFTDEDSSEININELAPYCKDGHFYDRVVFSKATLPSVYSEVIKSADVDVDDPKKTADTSFSWYEDFCGTYYSEETVSDEVTGETVPKTCGILADYSIHFYEYDPYEHCYKKSNTRGISNKRRTIQGFVTEFYDEDDPSKVWTLTTDYRDPYWLDLYYSSVSEYENADFFMDKRKVGSLISPRSRDYEWIFKTDREFLFCPSEDCISKSLAVPSVNDGVNYLDPDAISIRFNWNATDAAEGYEVWEETTYDGTSYDNYFDIGFTEVTDHCYYTGGQDDFIHRIRVRAFKTEDGRRVFSEWSPYATGKEANPLFGESSISQNASDKNVYKPVLDEYAKVFGGDESVYGLRAPRELYYEVTGFDGFDINDFYYAYCDFDPDYNDNVELLLLKKKDDKDCLYSFYRADSYPLELELDYVLSGKEGDYSGVYIEPAKEGEDIFLYDGGIVARSIDGNNYSVRSYIKLVSEPDMVPFHWDIIETVVRVTDSSGNNKYYRSTDCESLNYYPNEKKDLYEEISEKEFDETRRKYEVPVDLVRYPFAEYKGTP